MSAFITSMPKKQRAVNTGPRSEVGKNRRVLYRKCIIQVEKAIASGFFIEAVAIIESMIADRLESRTAFIHQQHPQKRKYSTVGRLAKGLREKECEPAEANEIYKKIEEWAKLRNRAMHELVKLSEDDSTDWDNRYLEAKTAALDGKKLFREVDKLVTRLNKKQSSPSEGVNTSDL